MYGMVLGGAWLLSVSGTAIEVLHHPSETFEFDSVVKLVQQYGNASQQKLAEQYACTPDNTLKRQAVPYDVILNPSNQERFQKALTSGTDFR